MVLIDRSNASASRSAPKGYRIQATGCNYLSISKNIPGAWGQPNTNYSVLIGSRPERDLRSCSVIGLGISARLRGHRHMGGLVPRISVYRLGGNWALGMSSWKDGILVLEPTWYTFLPVASRTGPRGPNSRPREGITSCDSEQLSQRMIAGRAAPCSGPSDFLPWWQSDKASLCHLCHSNPFMAFVSVLTLLIHWTGASGCMKYAGP